MTEITQAWFESRRNFELTKLLLYTQQQVPSFSEQCFLLEQADAIHDAIVKNQITISKPGSTDKGKKKVPVRQLGIKYPSGGGIDDNNVMSQKSNLNYIQKLTRLKRKNFEDYFNFTPNQISQLVHRISVSEVLIDQSDPSSVTPTPIMNTLENQKDFNSGSDLLKSSVKRLGAGIESIQVDFVGIDSFTKKQVKLDAKFFFQDIKQMMSSPYAGLFTLETAREQNGKKYFRNIDFFVGWGTNAKNIQRSVKELNLRIRTHLVKYSFDVRQDGSIVVDATYRGYYVEGFSGPQANILELAKRRYSEIKQRQEEIQNRATSVRTTNRSNIAQFEKRLFFLRMLRDASAYYFGLATPAYIDSKLSRTEYDSIIGSIKDEFKRFVIDAVNVTPAAQRLVPGFNSATGAAPPAAIEAYHDREGTVIFDEIFGTGQPIDIVNYIGLTTTAGRSILAGNEKVSKLRTDILSQVDLKIQLENNNLNTSQANFQNADKFAFDEQIRLANVAKLQALQEIAKRLVNDDDIKYALVNRTIVKNFKLASASASPQGIKEALALLGPPSNYIFNQGAAGSRISKDAFDEEAQQVVPFIFLGNLIENLLNIPADYTEASAGFFQPDLNETVYKLMTQAGSDVRIDLGYMSYNTPFTGVRVRNFKLYYLPISLKELNNFFTREVISKGRSFYSFNDFINDLLKKMLTGIFNTCAKESNTQSFSAPRIDVMIGDLPEKNPTTNRFQRTSQFFIHGSKDAINDLSRARPRITPSTFGKYQANINSSIPHFFVFGKSKGIEKNIKLIDIADNQLKAAVYYSPRSSLVNEIEGNNSLKHTGFVPAVFQTEIQTIGFPLMNIGQLIYVDLKPTITKKVAKSRPFDASGYYRVVKVSHSATKETFSTNITAILQISDKDRGLVKTGLGDLFGLEGEDSGVGTVGIGTSSTYTSAWASAGTNGTASTTGPSVVLPSATTPAAGAGTFDGAEYHQFPLGYYQGPGVRDDFRTELPSAIEKGLESYEFKQLLKRPDVNERGIKMFISSFGDGTIPANYDKIYASNNGFSVLHGAFNMSDFKSKGFSKELVAHVEAEYNALPEYYDLNKAKKAGISGVPGIIVIMESTEKKTSHIFYTDWERL